MRKRSTLALIGALCLSMVLSHAVRGDYVVKKDGTVLEGTVLKKKDGLWVKGKDGQAQTVPNDQVKESGKGEYKGAKPATGADKAKPATGAADKPAAAPAAGDKAAPKKKVGDYASTERRANAVLTAMAAVVIWQEYIDSKPPAEDLKKAKAEMKEWQTLADGKGEKIKGKWVAGEEREAIVGKAQALYKEGAEMMANDQTLQAVEKLKEAVSVYPNDFRSNFVVSYLMLIQHNPKEARKYLEAANKIRPNTPAVMSNLALLEVDKNQHVKAIEMFYKAAQAGDNKAIVQNLMAAISVAPPNVRKNQKVKQAMEAARLLASKHGVGPAGQFIIVPLEEGKPGGSGKPEDDPLVGAMSSGTGFIVSKDGLILTNRHVVDEGKSFMVLINGKEQRSAEVVVIDTEQDLALIRVKPDEGEDLPIVQLAPADAPGDGAACTVMGYPMMDRLGGSIKVTTGVVSSGNNGNAMILPDVTIDATVNPGNSGGPILDKYGNVMAIVSMKTIAQSGIENTYGLAISTGRIRKFLTKNKVDIKMAEVAAGAVALDTEQVAAKVKPATVCILATH